MEAPTKPEPLWTAKNGSYRVEGYDFTRWTKSDPPPIDAEPILLQFPVIKNPAF